MASKCRCREVKTAASIVVRGSVRVRVSGGSGGLKNTRMIEGMQRFILVRAIGALHPAADDPYTQEHPKSRGLQQSVKEEDLVGGLARC